MSQEIIPIDNPNYRIRLEAFGVSLDLGPRRLIQTTHEDGSITIRLEQDVLPSERAGAQGEPKGEGTC